jgi:ribonuclease HII
MLQSIYNCENHYIEIGIDEAGRGPLFGRLYVSAVVLPKIEYESLKLVPTNEILSIDKTSVHLKNIKAIGWKDIKDSKKIKSKTKMKACAEFIQKNALAYSIQYIEHSRIDEINIRQAVFEGMHNCIRNIITQLVGSCVKNMFLLIDGNDFKPFRSFIEETGEIFTLPYKTIEGGDNKYLAIAAASILAKYTRDTYIEELCKENPELDEKYGMNKNMGYGTKKHLEGIEKYGITQWHRKTYGSCKGK